MIILADEGDSNRKDTSCGVLYGVLRDSAYKLKKLGENERELHIKNNIWDIGEESLLPETKFFD